MTPEPLELMPPEQPVAIRERELGLNYPLTRQRIYRDKWNAEKAFAVGQ